MRDQVPCHMGATGKIGNGRAGNVNSPGFFKKKMIILFLYLRLQRAGGHRVSPGGHPAYYHQFSGRSPYRNRPLRTVRTRKQEHPSSQRPRFLHVRYIQSCFVPGFPRQKLHWSEIIGSLRIFSSIYVSGSGTYTVITLI